jgi:hypothetical protein
MKITWYCWILSLCILISAKTIDASSISDSTFYEINAVRIDLPIKITGRLDDPAWLRSFPVELRYEITPGENSQSKLRTTVMALYDNENLYFGFRCYDTVPESIRAHLADRDKIFRDDFVLVTIDPYNNYQKGYEYAVNPFGIQGDLLMMGSGMEDPSYDMVWFAEAGIDDKGWTAELAIPFSTLDFSPEDIQKWTISLLRCIPRENTYQVSWTPIDRNNPSYMAQGGRLTGLKDIKPGGSVDLLPYTMIDYSGPESITDDNDNKSAGNNLKARIGGGIEYSPGSNITINTVINPDFSQIETDADQVSVNTTFALEYPEKRPFFMSGMDLLQTPMYYSRTINNPLAATKINGKAGKISFLALAAYDRNSGIIIPGEEQSNTVETNTETWVGVGRARYDLGNESFVGTMLLTRNFSDAYNYVGGLDWSYKFWKNWYFQGELFLSRTKELNDTLLFGSKRLFGSTGYDAAFDGESYYGTGMHLSIRRTGRNYSFNLVQNNFSPTYQTYNGMFPEVNGRQTYIQNSYTIHPNKKLISNVSFLMNTTFNYNYDGVFKEFVIQPGIRIQCIGQTFLNASYMALNRERFRGILFDKINRSVFMLRTTPVRGLTLGISGQAGRFIYRTTDPKPGNGHTLTLSTDIEASSRLKTSFTVTLAELNEAVSGDQFYKGQIYRNITTYQFSRKLFFREITQYNTFSRSINIYPLISYKFNAFTMFCAGMTQDLIQDPDADSYSNSGYQYFVKLQYLFSPR